MGRRPLMTLWYAFNVLATFFLGFCHQGGVTGAVSAISSLEMSPRVTEATFVFSNTYMPPKFPLLLPAAPGDRERWRGYMWKHNFRYLFMCVNSWDVLITWLYSQFSLLKNLFTYGRICLAESRPIQR